MCKFANFPRFSDYLVYLGFYETHYYALFERNLVGTWNITLHQYWNSNFIVFFSLRLWGDGTEGRLPLHLQLNTGAAGAATCWWRLRVNGAVLLVCRRWRGGAGLSAVPLGAQLQLRKAVQNRHGTGAARLRGGELPAFELQSEAEAAP